MDLYGCCEDRCLYLNANKILLLSKKEYCDFIAAIYRLQDIDYIRLFTICTSLVVFETDTFNDLYVKYNWKTLHPRHSFRIVFCKQNIDKLLQKATRFIEEKNECFRC